MSKFQVWPVQEPLTHREVLQDHTTAVIVNEDIITPMLAWRANRTQHQIRKSMKREHDRGRQLVAIIMRIEKMN